MTSVSTPARPPLVALSVVSAAALAYEVLLTRLFAVVLWHHFAYMIISAALLGYGASGTFLALAGERIGRRFELWFVGAASLFGLAMPACFLLAQRVPFNPLELLWDGAQPAYLLVIYLLLIPPFFFAAVCVCLAISRFGGQAHRVYSFDILGAGAGSIGVVLALFALPAVGLLRALAGLGLAAAALAWIELRLRPRWLTAVLGGLAVILPFVIPSDWASLRPSPYKDLSQTLLVAGTRIVAQRSSPLGELTVVESPVVPFRHAPGLSLNALGEPPPQLGVFSDGDGLSAITRFDGRREAIAYLDYITSALPYHLLDRPRVLVLGAGTGADVLQGIFHGAAAIDAVELNPQTVELVRDTYGAFAGGIYSRPEVRVHVKEARGFVAGSAERYDLIQVALLDSFSTASAGLYALSENTLYTVEAFQDYLRHLRPDGLLAITRWITLPPRDALKLVTTAAVALERSGVSEPALHIALIRGWKTSTLLVRNGAFTEAELAALREFCRTRAFDAAYYPGMRREEANRYNVLDAPHFFDGAAALFGTGREAFIERYKFHIEPATDDRPYIFRFFKWGAVAELLALKEQGGLPLLEWGYPVLIITLVQALVASLVLILLPLRARRRTANVDTAAGRARVGVYFFAIGLAFMFVEIAFIQKFVLFLAHPLYAVAVVLCAFLVFAGIGSRLSDRLAGRGAAVRPLTWAVAGIAVLATGYGFVLAPLFQGLMHLPDAVRIGIALALIAPLALCMGVPFPSGITWLSADRQSLVPWAWAVNGCASVVGAVLATLLAIHLGFTVVVMLAVALYVVALLAKRGAL
jgi:SAM-dependent methyltransferase